ncbi:MAG: alanine--tRNA ligase-related protein, partial [Nitrosarchaeum sp.]
MDKKEILKEFSSDSDRYYKVKLFEEQGFVRKSCLKCKRFFWTLDSDRGLCPDDAEDTYSFIGDPPTTKRFDYTQAWKEVEKFFVKNGHTSVSRYPVVCRWRDDLYFTIASIVDFQRVMGSKVVFEFPANPLIVPQTCLRFKDLENVGVTGRHFSSFCMIGQHSIPNSEGYWKDKCVDLDFRLLTEQFGIKKEEVVFVEDVWAGGGSFGSSLEYFVRGLELGNAVFTEFQGELGNHTTLDQKIIDMGAGLERFAWITKGTPTAYDCCFGPITNHLFEKIGIDSDSEMLRKYFTAIAKNLEIHEDLSDVRRHAVKSTGLTQDQVNRIITPLEGMYLIADHLRTLIFAITDGALPSNVGGGYNLRMMLRRINGTMDRMNLKLDIDELVDMHIDYLRDTYPELDAKRQDVKTILKIESERYVESKTRMGKMAGRLKEKGRAPTVDELITLYESDGITPEYLKEIDVISEIPSSFYA